jgi:hypothetical protein
VGLRRRLAFGELPPVEWFYAKDGKRIGPLSESSLEQRLGSGEVDLDTWVWRRGMEDWAPLRVVRTAKIGGAPAFNAPPPLKRQVCAECGTRFPADDLVRIAGRWTCADCKATVLQKLQEGLLHTDTDEATRTGKLIVVGRNGVLPPRCVKCNLPAHGKPKSYRVFMSPNSGSIFTAVLFTVLLIPSFFPRRDAYWFLPALILIMVLINGVVSLIRGRRVHVGVGVCAEHTRKRFVMGAASYGVLLGGILLMFFGVLGGGEPWLFVVSCIVLVGGAFIGYLRGNLVTASKADKNHVWLKGAGPEFLDSLPEWSGE